MNKLEHKINKLEATLNYQEVYVKSVQKKLEKVRKELEKLKKNKNSLEPTPKGWIPDDGEKYWFANINLKPSSFKNETHTDEDIIKYNRIFKTEKECQLYCDIQRAFIDASREFALGDENYFIYHTYGTTKIDRYEDEKICFGINFCATYSNTIYFDSKGTIQKLIDKFGEENVKRYYLGVY